MPAPKRKPARGGLGCVMDQREAIKRSIAYAEAREEEQKRPYGSSPFLDVAIPAGLLLLAVGAIASVGGLVYGVWNLL